jgi:hypothetical protein
MTPSSDKVQVRAITEIQCQLSSEIWADKVWIRAIIEIQYQLSPEIQAVQSQLKQYFREIGQHKHQAFEHKQKYKETDMMIE